MRQKDLNDLYLFFRGADGAMYGLGSLGIRCDEGKHGLVTGYAQEHLILDDQPAYGRAGVLRKRHRLIQGILLGLVYLRPACRVRLRDRRGTDDPAPRGA